MVFVLEKTIGLLVIRLDKPQFQDNNSQESSLFQCLDNIYQRFVFKAYHFT